MVKIMVPNPIKMDDLGFFPIFLGGLTPISTLPKFYSSPHVSHDGLSNDPASYCQPLDPGSIQIDRLTQVVMVLKPYGLGKFLENLENTCKYQLFEYVVVFWVAFSDTKKPGKNMWLTIICFFNIDI